MDEQEQTEINMYDIHTLYKQELNHYRNLLQLTHRLERAVEQGKIEDLEPLFSKRKKILAKISVHEEGAGALSEKVNKPNADEEEKLAGIIEEIREITKKVMDMDGKIEEKLKSKKDRIHDQLKKVRQGRKALKGYAPKRRHIPRYISKKG